MKAWIPLTVLPLITFSAGVYLGEIRATPSAPDRFALRVAKIHQTLYGVPRWHRAGPAIEFSDAVRNFDPAKSAEATIEVLYARRGSPLVDGSISLSQNGAIRREADGRSVIVNTLAPEACREFFQQVLASGVLTCSTEVIAVKLDFAPEQPSDEGDETIFRIYVPELGVNQRVAIDSLAKKHEKFPELVELKIMAELEKQLRRMALEQ